MNVMVHTGTVEVANTYKFRLINSCYLNNLKHVLVFQKYLNYCLDKPTISNNTTIYRYFAVIEVSLTAITTRRILRNYLKLFNDAILPC